MGKSIAEMALKKYPIQKPDFDGQISANEIRFSAYCIGAMNVLKEVESIMACDTRYKRVYEKLQERIKELK